MSNDTPAHGGIWPFVSVAALILAADQFTKRLAVLHLKPIPGGIPLPGRWLWLDYTENQGGAFGILQHFIPIFVLTGVVVVALIIWFWARIARLPLWQRLAYGLVLGGTVGNLYDRLHQGFVVDFLDLRWFPVFNIADSAICVGLGMIALALLRTEPPARTPNTIPAEGTPSTDESRSYGNSSTIVT